MLMSLLVAMAIFITFIVNKTVDIHLEVRRLASHYFYPKVRFNNSLTHTFHVNSRGLRVFVLSFVRPPTRETTVFNISFMRLFVTEAG